MAALPLPFARCWRWALAGLAAVVVAISLVAVRCAGAEAARDPACESRSFEGEDFTVCTFDSRRRELRLVVNDEEGAALRSFAALEDVLGADARRVRFAMNAGMFDDAGAPIGLYVEDGVQKQNLSRSAGPGNFHLKPNGVFSVAANGEMRIDTTETYYARAASPAWATQSGPMLVIGGALHPSIQDDGPSRYLRDGVGVRGAHTALFVISEAPISFGKLARFFRDELGCRDALYLDGSVSSLWRPEANRIDDGVALGPMVVVLDRS